MRSDPAGVEPPAGSADPAAAPPLPDRLIGGAAPGRGRDPALDDPAPADAAEDRATAAPLRGHELARAAADRAVTATGRRADAAPVFADPAEMSRPLWLVRDDAALPRDLPDHAARFASAAGFRGKAGELLLLPDPSGALAGALFGLGRDGSRRERFALARAAAALPAGAWRLAALPDGVDPGEAAFAFLLAQYRFDRYARQPAPAARLVPPEGSDPGRLRALAAGEFLTRDLINTPANDLGPEALETAAREVAARGGLAVRVIRGEALLDANLPLIHAVGRAGAEAPRLIELASGGDGPGLTLVGKGVCFDTGGLNIKPGASMGLMKKDMGGAATVLGLTQMLVETGAATGLRLRVLIPAVENAISAAAMRPGDILRARCGRTVEVNNTDAEGRLILADALSLGGEDAPALMMSVATLTGAARVALGPDLPALFCDDDATAEALLRAGSEAWDPLWRLPLWPPYESMIEPGIADLDNAPSGGMAGAITAALFLQRFAGGARRYAHLDIYGWTPAAKPGRPKGGVAQGARAILAALPAILPHPAR